MNRVLLAALISVVSVAQAAPVLQNTSFETNNVVGTGSSAYKATGTIIAEGWTFSNPSGSSTGIARDGSVWQGNSPYGDYYAWLQKAAAITQTFVSTEAYDYDFSFNLELRRVGTYGAQPQVVRMTFDDATLGEFEPLASGSWKTFSASIDNVAAGTHTIRFIGLNPLATDTTAFLDNIVMTTTAIPTVPEPETYALLLAGLGLVGFAVRRKRNAAI
jgi:hypothetical protein